MTPAEKLSPRQQQAIKNRRTGALLVGVIIFLVLFSLLFVTVINPRIHRGVPVSARAAVHGQQTPEPGAP
jgi:hypothetical protein